MNIDIIIPARSHSKRIYHKNTILIGGKPLIEYTVEAALSASSIRSIYLSTDDKELIARYKGHRRLKVAVRPKALADDDVSLKDAVSHAINSAADEPLADMYVVLPPTAPFRTSAHIDAAIKFALSLPGFDSVAGVALERNTPYGGLLLDPKNGMKPLVKTAPRYHRYQDQPPTYRLNNSIWIIPAGKITRLNDLLLSGRSYGFVMDELDSVSIDTPYDVMVAEAILAFQKERFSWTGRGGYNVQRFYAHDDRRMAIRRNIFDAAAYERHFHRYKYFLQHIRSSDDILDIACGSGYGSQILAGKAKSVHGVDTDAKTIEYAKRNYMKPNVRFSSSPIESFSPKKRYDKIISVETIEHLKDPEAYLARARGWLKPGGVIWLTCPLSEPDKEDTSNPFHISSLTYGTLKAMMLKQFSKVDFFNLTGPAVFSVDTLNNRATYIVARGSLK